MSNSFYYNKGSMFAKHYMPVLLDCNFVVDSANANGLGIRSLKGPGIASVYMHTSSTPAAGNPNPAAGMIIVNLQDNYNRYFGGFSGMVSPISGTPILVASAGVTAHTTYVIVSLGTTSTAGWQSLGLPLNIVPAVGVSFVATATTTATGTGAVETIVASGIDHIEVVGDPNSMNGLPAVSQGMQIISACFKNTVLTAPADGSVVSIAMYLSNSSLTVQGE